MGSSFGWKPRQPYILNTKTRLPLSWHAPLLARERKAIEGKLAARDFFKSSRVCGRNGAFRRNQDGDAWHRVHNTSQMAVSGVCVSYQAASPQAKQASRHTVIVPPPLGFLFFSTTSASPFATRVSDEFTLMYCTAVISLPFSHSRCVLSICPLRQKRQRLRIGKL